MNKFRAISCEIDGYKFDSKREGKEYHDLKMRLLAREITNLQIHPKYPIFINDIKICVVELDFKYLDKIENRERIVDVKGFDTPISKLKRKMVEAFYKIKVEIVK